MLSRPPCAIIIVLATICTLAILESYSPSSAANALPTGAIPGKVTRLDGTTAIAGATVKVYQGTTLLGTATTNATGDYTVGSLATGTYSVEASAGYETTIQTGISVTDGATATLNVSLPVPINYVYDELGRLVAVIDKDGNAATYSYDAVGNLLSISRQVPTQVAIIQFSPGSGSVATSVTIYGAGFSATASQNSVTFNGTAATVTASSTNVIVTSVPAGATTGTINITSPTGSATSSASFTVSGVTGAPTITGFTPTIATSGTSITINGTNFETTPINDTVVINTSSSQTNSAAANSIGTTIPAQTGSGKISVTTPAGKAISSADLFIPPPTYTATDVEFTARMSIGGASTATISTANKIGMIVFDGTANQQVSIRATGVTVTDSWVHLYSPYAAKLSSAQMPFSSLMDAVTLPTTGTYTILIDPTSTYTGSMTLTLYDCTEITGTITPGGSAVTVTATVPGQNARLTFNGTAGQRISLNMTSVTIAASWVYINKPSGTTLTSAGVSSSSYFIDTTTLPFNGQYTILVDPTGANTQHDANAI
jgi:YD repeat-containing protein